MLCSLTGGSNKTVVTLSEYINVFDPLRVENFLNKEHRYKYITGEETSKLSFLGCISFDYELQNKCSSLVIHVPLSC